jgi:hypothetical protein
MWTTSYGRCFNKSPNQQKKRAERSFKLNDPESNAFLYGTEANGYFASDVNDRDNATNL